jgi:hypothetical protein
MMTVSSVSKQQNRSRFATSSRGDEDKQMRGVLGAAALVVVLVLAGAACGAGPSAQPGARPSPPASSSAAIAWLPLPAAHHYPTAPTPPATPRPPIPVPPGTPTCQASQLQGAAAGDGAATGNVNMPIVVRNRGAAACVLAGWADLTILDRRGHLLAAAAGRANRETFFNDWPKVPVLMQPGTPPLPARPGFEQPPSRGQAVMNLSWYDCRQPQAAVLVLDLPNAGGRLRVPFDRTDAYSPACDNPGAGAKPAGVVLRGPLSPAGFTWPPAPHYLDIGVAIHLPATVRRGTTLVYQVTLTNRSDADYRLDPCPDYNEILGRKDIVASYQLNCQPVGAIAPGERVTFQMQLAIPATTVTGPNKLIWALLDGRIATPVATAPLTISDR